MFKTMKQLRARNAKIGHIFFDHATMKLWNSKIESGLYNGTYFITSEKGRSATDVRKYTIRMALKSGEITTVGKAMAFSDKDSARAAIRALVRLK